MHQSKKEVLFKQFDKKLSEDFTNQLEEKEFIENEHIVKQVEYLKNNNNTRLR